MSFILILPLDIHSDKPHSFYDKIYFMIFLKLILYHYLIISEKVEELLAAWL